MAEITAVGATVNDVASGDPPQAAGLNRSPDRWGWWSGSAPTSEFRGSTPSPAEATLP